jgi:hypothetical protein
MTYDSQEMFCLKYNEVSTYVSCVNIKLLFLSLLELSPNL